MQAADQIKAYVEQMQGDLVENGDLFSSIVHAPDGEPAARTANKRRLNLPLKLLFWCFVT